MITKIYSPETQAKIDAFENGLKEYQEMFFKKHADKNTGQVMLLLGVDIIFNEMRKNYENLMMRVIPEKIIFDK